MFSCLIIKTNLLNNEIIKIWWLNFIYLVFNLGNLKLRIFFHILGYLFRIASICFSLPVTFYTNRKFLLLRSATTLGITLSCSHVREDYVPEINTTKHMKPFSGKFHPNNICTNHMLKFLNQTNIIFWDSQKL